MDERADIYSLGAVFYEMLTGQPPFIGLSVAETIARHILDVPPSFPDHLQIPPALEEVIMRALAKQPENRFETVGELANALRAGIQPVKAPPRRRGLARWAVAFRSFLAVI